MVREIHPVGPELSPYVNQKSSLSFPALRRGKEWLIGKFGRVVEDITVPDDTKLTLLPSGRKVIEGIKELVHSAEDHVTIQSYSFDIDVVGKDVVGSVAEAAQKRPHVRRFILVDNSIAWWNYNGTVRRKNHSAQKQKDETFEVLNRLQEAGIADVRVTNWYHVFRRGASNPFHRDHKKVTVADGKRAIIGSANIGDHHVKWQDVGVLVEGPVAKVIEADVTQTLSRTERWKRIYQAKSIGDYLRRYKKDLLTEDADEFLQDVLGALVRNPQRRGKKTIIHSPSEIVTVGTDSFWWPYREATRMAYEMVGQAQKGDVVAVVSPYPGMYRLTKRLLKAARMGAEVNVYIPAQNNYALYNPGRVEGNRLPAKAARLVLEEHRSLWYKRLQEGGVHVFAYDGDEVSQGMIHAKAVSVQHADGTAEVLLGSMNLAMGLFAGSNREIALKIQNPQFTHDFYEQFIAKITKQSHQLC